MKPFPFLIAALALTLNAQDAKPGAELKPTLEVGGKAAEAPKADQKFFAQVWTATSPQEFVNFQQRIRILAQQVEEFKRSQVFLENALTTPEREARSHEIAAKQAKLKGDWLVKLPSAFSPRQAMAIGTAGYTAMLCVMALEDVLFCWLFQEFFSTQITRPITSAVGS